MSSVAASEQQQPETLRGALSGGYAKIFGQQWPVWIGGVLFGAINVFLFAFDKPWSAADGVRNWGDWFFNSVGLADREIITPYLYSTSVLNFGIVGGALAAALLARQFGVRMAPPWELFKGFVGGCLMGVGSALAFGCNIGGFFSATAALSMAGLVMMGGLMVGVIVGLKLLVWEVSYISLPAWAERLPPSKKASRGPGRAQPWWGLAVLVAALAFAFLYDSRDFPIRGGFLLFGVVIGLFMQRTRFCFVRAFREPFMTGDGDATKAAAIAIIIAAIGFTILKWTDLREWETQVSSGFWLGSLLGGFIFGLGMSLSGGCATGSLWRAGEGHVKLWVAVIAFALSGSLFRGWMADSGIINRLGEPLFLPDVIGFKMALIAVIAVMCLWYVLATWNEVKRKLVIV
jgi:uncharacterized membrane protein YedE/YeeE